ncbi:MFS transporter [Arthrobacter oryzae]|uniref:MFS transporter n=1 Tax=Arthrobacter oryzae TaxID=409290 RepID=UPI00273CE124|nr:MFS transporter [Arthrobacter oryzae]WLQ07676.1 MFS transporter [Arthrobacter oryzae]
MTSTVGTPADVQVHKSHLRTLIGTGIGNAVEWYDWAIYATFSPFIASALFSKADPTSAFLATLAIFAVGFVARPFGGFVFGWIGDRIGRKTSMTFAVGLAALGSLLIGIAPTFEAVGAFASVMLLVARLIQGLAHGGELPSSQTYLSEMAPKEKRGFWATLIYTSGTAGILAGTLLGAVLSNVLSQADMNAWGWRIPFLIGGALGVYALVMRARMRETEAFAAETPKEKHEPMWPQIYRHRKQALQVIGLTVGLTVSYYIWGVVAPSYAATALKMDRGEALWAGVIANIVFIAALPFWGKLSDRIGRKPVLIAGSAGAALFHFPMTWLLKDSPWQLAVTMSVMLFFIAASAAIVPAVYAELFPTKIRTVGVGVPYSICVAAFGGTAPYLQTWLGTIGQANLFNVYAVLLLLVGIAFVFTIPETKGKDLTH